MPTAEEVAKWRSCPSCGGPLEHEDGSVSCAACGAKIYSGPAPTASAVIVDEGGRVLLSRRAGEPGEDLWDLPGGFIDEGEYPLDTLHRELREEAGVEIEPGAFLAGVPDRYGDDGAWTLNLYWEARVVSGEPRAADDVAEFRWFSREALPRREEFAFPNTVELLESWGATFSGDPPSA